jgi:dienelactone hydrolase
MQRLLPTLLASLSLLTQSHATQEPSAPVKEVIQPVEWLVLPGIDATGRRPFRPDQVFARYLLERSSPAPVAGQKLTGETGAGEWTAFVSKTAGEVAPGFQAGWAYTSVDVDEAGVYMAKASGASRLFVGGAGFAGDVYRYGFGGVPVALSAGTNSIFLTGLRGSPRLTLTRVDGDALVPANWDALVPDLERGATARTQLEVPVFNASTSHLTGANWSAREVKSTEEGGGALVLKTVRGSIGPVLPLAPFSLRIPVRSERKLTKLSTPNLHLYLEGDWSAPDADAKPKTSGEPAAIFQIPARDPGVTHRVVFESAIDGSLQEYGLVERDPELATDGLEPSLVLSLHGAGVPTMSQARAYGRKGDFSIAAALNRRPYGFDWQDWGRQDTYEALDHALFTTGVDDERVFLTGHSMGGHGTWHLGANDPDRFLAIAPSAGWSSFDSYGGRPAGELASLWQRADGSSLTLNLMGNLVQVPTFVLHGTADDNVPASEAELMMAAREAWNTETKAELRSHFEEGAGHWWGNQCVDWPGIFELFTEIAAELPQDAWRPQPTELYFRTVDPAVDSKHYWVEVLQPRVYGEPVVVTGDWDPDTRVLRVSSPSAGALILHGPNRGRPIEWIVGETTFAGAATQRTLHVVRDATGSWVQGRPTPGEKGPDHAGPFKRAFDNGFVLVYGTAGQADEDLELMERARYDLGRWSYRAAAEVAVLSDVQFSASMDAGDAQLAGCNVILYGNGASNSAWNRVLGEAGDIEVLAGKVRIGESVFEGDDLLLLAVAPRRDAAPGAALVGIFGSTGVRGARLGYEVPVFVSGVGLPDWSLVDSTILQSGDAGVLGAGWLDKQWGMQAPELLKSD